MGMTINNVLGFIWACFSAIITMRVANPLYDLVFGLDWSGHLMTMYGLKIAFAIIVFGICFFIPFKTFTEVSGKLNWRNQTEYYNG